MLYEESFKIKLYEKLLNRDDYILRVSQDERAYFQARLADKKTPASERPGITQRLELLNSASQGLRSRSVEFHH